MTARHTATAATYSDQYTSTTTPARPLDVDDREVAV